MKKIGLILLPILFILLIINSHADDIDWDILVNAIYKAEGGIKATYLYGIRSIKYDTPEEARQICYNSIRNNYKRWIKAGKPKDFISFMGNRYCPPTMHKLNQNWVKNVRYFYGKN